ncbi:hypothetical protein SAMN04487967_1095 [Natronorubrum sediminis]|uniref:Uncharacterized protein n=1 Tax=Natronorubrum sediminis TaxID=640943 RepID=A0A1H6FS44_9EURY|nr:hypothetical protein [Natronorubrum sediminis]SEH13020.1 hypothetical protein SAMN04487967_1095 [Natronorubrum sediminis]
MSDDQSDRRGEPTVNRRRVLRATAVSVASVAGIAGASSSATAVNCECTAAEASECGPAETCYCHTIVGGSHLNNIRSTTCEADESDAELDCGYDDPEDMTVEELESSPTYSCE